MLMSRLSSLAHKLPMLMFMLMLASLVRTGLQAASITFDFGGGFHKAELMTLHVLNW